MVVHKLLYFYRSADRYDVSQRELPFKTITTKRISTSI